MNTLIASGSLPFLAKKMEIDGRYYLDGGLKASIPLEQSLKDGNDKKWPRTEVLLKMSAADQSMLSTHIGNLPDFPSLKLTTLTCRPPRLPMEYRV